MRSCSPHGVVPAFKHDERKPFIAKPHQTCFGASNYVGPSMKQPVFYTTPAPQQLIYVCQPQQQQYASAGMIMLVSVLGGYIQGHFVPTTAVQLQPGPTAQPASDLPRSSGVYVASAHDSLVLGTPGPSSAPNLS